MEVAQNHARAQGGGGPLQSEALATPDDGGDGGRHARGHEQLGALGGRGHLEVVAHPEGERQTGRDGQAAQDEEEREAT